MAFPFIAANCRLYSRYRKTSDPLGRFRHGFVTSALRQFCHASGLRDGDPTGRSAGMAHEDIHDMVALRARIDALDARLIALLAERSTLIDRAAQIKAQVGLPARIDARVEEVAALARRRATDAGLDPDLAEGLWRLMMEHFIAQEEAQLGGGHGGATD